MQYFTGSKAHNVVLRERAVQQGYKLNEYGLFRDGQRVAGATEEELFATLELDWIPAELREDRGEIEAAERHTLPTLIEVGDLQGDLHVHTNASDGSDPLKKMVSAAQARGLQYIAITDHAKYLGVTRGLDADRFSRQADAIESLSETLDGFTVLKGAEVDILEDGSLCLPDEVLRRLDLVVVAVHTQLSLSAAKQTTRILRALERPCVTILAHPFGRLLGERAACELDFERVLESVRDRGCYLEVNAQPLRLDLDDIHAKAARDQGILLSIASDGHSADQFAFLENGVRQGRRAWLTRTDVLNSRPLRDLRPLLRRTMR